MYASLYFFSLHTQVDADEIKVFIQNFNQGGQDNFKTSGVKMGKEKYMYLSSNDKVARFKKGTSGIHTIKTTQGINVIVVCLIQSWGNGTIHLQHREWASIEIRDKTKNIIFFSFVFQNSVSVWKD